MNSRRAGIINAYISSTQHSVKNIVDTNECFLSAFYFILEQMQVKSVGWIPRNILFLAIEYQFLQLQNLLFLAIVYQFLQLQNLKNLEGNDI